jgi:hypothetical protein
MGILMSKTLQERLDEAAKLVQPIFEDVLDKIEASKE